MLSQSSEYVQKHRIIQLRWSKLEVRSGRFFRSVRPVRYPLTGIVSTPKDGHLIQMPQNKTIAKIINKSEVRGRGRGTEHLIFLKSFLLWKAIFILFCKKYLFFILVLLPTGWFSARGPKKYRPGREHLWLYYEVFISLRSFYFFCFAYTFFRTIRYCFSLCSRLNSRAKPNNLSSYMSYGVF